MAKEKKSAYENLNMAVTRILKKQNKNNAENTISGPDLLKAIEKEGKDTIPQGTFNNYITDLVRDPNTQISCKGPRQGYFLGKELPEKKGPTHEDTDSDKEYARREAKLYDVLKNWLLSQGYNAKITSPQKNHGWWGNPDITGIKTNISLQTEIEVATIEVKLTTSKWEHWIFEAVSHKRFSNRAFFAFAYSDASVPKLPAMMRYYSELYKIGIIAVLMDDKDLETLESSKGKDIEKLTLDDSTVEIRVIYSAPYTHIQPFHQVAFLEESLEIKNQSKLTEWGETPPKEGKTHKAME